MYHKYLVPLALVIFAPAAFAAPQPSVSRPATIDRVSQIDRVAKQITVRIEAYNDEGNFTEHGSGVLVSRKGNSYTLVTADHVIHYRSNDGSRQPDGKVKSNRFQIVTPDGQKYSIQPNSIYRQSALDLATFKITSNKSYQLARIAATDRVASSFTDRERVFVAGYPDPTKFKRKSQQWVWYMSVGNSFSRGQNFFATKNNNSSTQGYELTYYNLTYGGMSGGAVLNTQGQLIGIHGRQENLATGYGLSLGIPIGVFNGLTTTLGVDRKMLNYQAPLSALSAKEDKILNSQIADRQKTELNNSPKPATANQWLTRGVQQIRTEQTDGAISSLNNAIKLEPNLAPVYYTKGILFDRQNKSNEAITEFERAIQYCQYPAVCTPTLREQSRVALSLNRYPEALKSINKAIELESNDAFLYNIKGNILTKLKRYSEAIAVSEKAIAINPNPYFYYDRGIAYYLSGNKEQGIADFKQTFERNPNAANLYTIQAINSKIYDLTKFDTLNAVISFKPKFVWAYIARGNAHKFFLQQSLSRADYQKAKELILNNTAEFSDGIEGKQLEKTRLITLGNIHQQLEEYPQALAVYNRLIQIDPDQDSLYYERARTLYELGRYTQALVDCNRGIQLDPENANNYSGRRRVYDKLGREQEALSDLNLTIELQTKQGDRNGLAINYLSRGIRSYTAKKYPQAIADFDQAIKLDPINLEFYTAKSQTYEAMGKYSEGIVALTKSIELTQSEQNTNFQNQAIAHLITSYSARARLYEKAGNKAAAQSDALKTLSFDPSKIDNNSFKQQSYTARGQAYDTLGQYPQAIADFDLALTLDPKHVLTYLARGQTKNHAGKYPEAIADFELALKLDPQNQIVASAKSSVYVSSGQSKYNSGKYEAAITDFTLALKLESENITNRNSFLPAYIFRGLSSYRLNRYADGISDLTKAISIEPKNILLYTVRANIYTDWGKSDLALTDLDRAIQIDPQSIAAYTARADLYINQAKYNLALPDLTKSIQLEPKNNEHYFQRAVLYYLAGEPQTAIADLDRAIAIKPLANYYSMRGLRAENLGQYERAIADHNKSIELAQNPNEKSKYTVSLGLNYFQQGKYDLALASLNTAIKLNPQSTFAYADRAKLFERLGSDPQALADVNTALKLDPEDQIAYLVMARLYIKQNNPAQVQAITDKILKIDQNNPVRATQARSYRVVGFIQAEQGEIEQAISSWKRSVEINPGTSYESQLAMASVLYGQGKTSEALQLAKPILSRYPHLKDPQYLTQSLWNPKLLVLVKKMYSDRRFSVIWDLKSINKIIN
jgi:tetratricopeptide (TPR) repeat protein/V8-like Glu-specific endopeptidase